MIKVRLFFTVLLCYFTTIGLLHSQERDTLTLSKNLLSKKEYKAAEKLLSIYYDGHRNDLYAGWLYGQSLHFTKQYKKSRAAYTTAIKLFPENDILILDYSNKLAESGQLMEAIKMIKPYARSKSGQISPAAKALLARIYYWQGEYEMALKQVNRAIRADKNNPGLIDLKNKIMKARSNWMSIDVSYFEDDQPLTTISPTLESFIYLNSKSSVGLSAALPVFITADDTTFSQSITGKAHFQWKKYKIKSAVTAGVTRFPSGALGWNGSFRIEKNLYRKLNVSLKASHLPYFATTAAISGKLMQTNFGLSLSWDDARGWLGKASMEADYFFSLNNFILKQSAWLVSPPVTFSFFKLRVGYGVNYSDTKENTFSYDGAISDIPFIGDTTALIEGNYDPFFAPDKQIVHSAIGILSVDLSKKMVWGLNVNYGFYAKTNTPYLFLNAPDDGNLVIERGFIPDRYIPLEIASKLSYEVGSRIMLTASYSYLRTNYYVRQYAGLAAKILFK